MSSPAAESPTPKTRAEKLAHYYEQTELVRARASWRKALRDEIKFQVEALMYEQKLVEIMVARKAPRRGETVCTLSPGCVLPAGHSGSCQAEPTSSHS